MIVLVTGGTGFIGTRLVACLRKDGHELRILSRNLKSEESVQCDLQNEKIPESVLKNIDIVLHLAGYAHDMSKSSKFNDLYYKINVDATVKLANLSVKAGVKKFIFVSSVKAGGVTNSDKCLSEKDLCEPEGIYGRTKREAELKLLKIHKDTSMNISIIRPSLVYGPNMKGNLKLMLAGIKKGWFPPLPETGNKRSMIHVDDLARAILFLAFKHEANGEIFNATDGEIYSSGDIYDTLCNLSGKSLPKWRLPEFLFNFSSLINSNIKYKINKLLGNACYSSAKLEALGFKAKKN